MDKKEYLETKVKPIIENIILECLLKRPKNSVQFMIEHLQKTGGYTGSGLTINEKNELEQLRRDINKYRELEANENDHKEEHNNIDSEEDLDDVEDVIDEKQLEIDLRKKSVIGPRSGVSAEVYGKYHNKGNFKPKIIPKSDEQIQRIKLKILQSFLFESLDQKDVEIVINAMEERSFIAGDTIITQGEKGDVLYIIESGELDCYKTFKDSEPRLVKQYFPGDAFGELALLYNAPRAATVKAKSTCILWSLDRETFNTIVKESSMKRREQYENFLKTVDILQGIDNYELTQICDALKTCNFNEGEYVIKEGEFGDVFYIVLEGEAIATKTIEPGKPCETVKEYQKGDYFGELALLKGEPRAANIIAKSSLKLLSLDRFSFKRLLGPIENILARNSERY